MVLFARTAPEEANHKNLVPQLPLAQQQPIFEAFNQNSLALLAATGLPYFLITSAGQKGHTFGERLYQALAQTFAQGYEQVIVIGNDCPQLQVEDLLRASHLLKNNGSVLGPNHNGGIYLLGLHKSVFEKAACFTQIGWQTPALLQELTALLQQPGEGVACLTTYSDINNPQDLQKARRNKWLGRSLCNWIHRLVAQLVPRLPGSDFFALPACFQPAVRFRGPPLFV